MAGSRLDIGAEDTQSAPGAESEAPSDEMFESFLAALAASPPPYRPPRLEPGDVFAERYRVERELGRGGMGTVYLTTDLELGRKVALKIALGRRADAELERLQQEATIMAGLSHPGIVTVFEATAAGDDLYITLEFVPGGTLRDWIDLERRGWREATALFVEIADALSAAHEASIIHRDFKPANVLLGLDGRPRIADFGLARSEGLLDTQEMRLLQASATTRTGAVMGTPAYMAPEQARGDAATAAADQFSFFVSLYEAICGRRPFTGDTLLALMDNIEAGPPNDYPGMPRSLVAVMRQGLAFDPAARHADMGTVAAALRRVLHERRRKLRIGGLALGVVAATTFGYFAAPKAEPPCQRAELSASIDTVWSAARPDVTSEAGEETSRALDGYRDQVVDQRVAACESHTVRSELSDTDFALRTACLDRAEARFAGLVDDLVATPRALGDLGDVLPSPQDCTDTLALRRYANAFASTSRFDTNEQLQANAKATRLLTRAKLQAMRGERFEDLAQEIIALADAHGLSTNKAETLLLLASKPGLVPAERSAFLDQAVAAAGEALAPEFLSDVAAQRAGLALVANQPQLARAHLDHAEALASLSVSRTERDQLELDLVRQNIAVFTRETAESVDELQRILEQLPEADDQRSFALRLLAEAFGDRNRLREAELTFAELLAQPGTREPFQRFAFNINRAVTLYRAGRAEDAKAAVEAGRAAHSGPLTDDLEGAVRIAEGSIALLEGHLDQASERLQSAAELIVSVDPEAENLGEVWCQQARLALLRDEPREAFEKTKAAMALADRVNGPGSPEAARALTLMSPALLALGHGEKAAEAAKTAAGFLRERARPADEIALAELAQARASGEENPRARRICEDSELVACREALAPPPAATALSP